MTQKFHNLALPLLVWLTFNSPPWMSFSREKVCFLWSTRNSKLIFYWKGFWYFSPTELLNSLKVRVEPSPYFLRWPITPWTSKTPSRWHLKLFFYKTFLEYPGKIGKFDCTNFTLGENESQQSCDSPKTAQRIRVRDRRRTNIPIPTAMFQAFGGLLSQHRNWAEN